MRVQQTVLTAKSYLLQLQTSATFKMDSTPISHFIFIVSLVATVSGIGSSMQFTHLTKVHNGNFI
jgi:hypothetical protein